MEQDQHTPGPWTPGPWHYWDTGRQQTVGPDQKPILFRLIHGSAADARLIAAAPELYTHLKAMLELPVFSGIHEGQAEWIDSARSAIAKAEGQT